MKQKSLVLVGLAFFCALAPAKEVIQSRFMGPVDLLVWEHEQASWNVEVTKEQSAKFFLFRGWRDNGVAFVRLIVMNRPNPNTKAKIWGKSIVRNGEYSSAERDIPAQEMKLVEMKNGSAIFELDTNLFVDISGERFLTEANFEATLNGQPVLSYGVKPMFARGQRANRWDTTIDGYHAHAGKGSIRIRKGIDETDSWNGVKVQPDIAFLDNNEYAAGFELGMHRHIRNQEMWYIVKGQVMASHALAPITGAMTRVRRKWSPSGETREVDQFSASGGWLEDALLDAGDFMVIVPNPADEHRTVCAHGLLAHADTLMITTGKQN